MTHVSVYDKPLPESEFIDEVRIVVRERYKTSGMSGDEWRYNRVVQLFRKGRMLHEQAYNGNMHMAASFLPWTLASACESGEIGITAEDSLRCFQPGCSELAVTEYALIDEFSDRGERLHPDETKYSERRRRFCLKHVRRGDCSREDCDANYRLVSGPGPDEADMSRANITESRCVTIQVDAPDEIINAVGAVRDGLRTNPSEN